MQKNRVNKLNSRKNCIVEPLRPPIAEDDGVDSSPQNDLYYES
jgi:hypothetical protein